MDLYLVEIIVETGIISIIAIASVWYFLITQPERYPKQAAILVTLFILIVMAGTAFAIRDDHYNRLKKENALRESLKDTELQANLYEIPEGIYILNKKELAKSYVDITLILPGKPNHCVKVRSKGPGWGYQAEGTMPGDTLLIQDRKTPDGRWVRIINRLTPDVREIGYVSQTPIIRR